MDKHVIKAKLESLGVKVTKDEKILKSDLEKVLSHFRVQANQWQEGNLIDLGIAPISRNDQSEPVMYKSVDLLYVVGKDESDGSFRYDIYHGQKTVEGNSGFGSADEAIRAADRVVKGI